MKNKISQQIRFTDKSSDFLTNFGVFFNCINKQRNEYFFSMFGFVYAYSTMNMDLFMLAQQTVCTEFSFFF